jgi:hypothetical protein
MKARLDAAAERSGRSQSQEAELRLERSFEREDLLPELLRTAFGSVTAGHLLVIGFLMTNAGLREYWSRHSDDLAGEHSWPNDPTAFDQAVQSALTWLNAAKPAGEVLESQLSPGVRFANNMIESLQHPQAQIDPASRYLAAIRSLLGPITERMAEAGGRAYRNPFPLAIAVMEASKALERFQEQHTRATQAAGPESSKILPAEPVAQIVERCLGKFLVGGWDRCWQTDEDLAESEELTAEIQRRA